MANYQSTHTGAEIDAGIDLLDSNSATSGQVLTANGTGGASWQNAGGGGGGDIYLQTIEIDATKSTDTIAVYFSIYTKSSEPINTLAKLKTALKNSYISGTRKYIAATGLLAVGTTSVYNITAIKYNYEGAIEITSYKHDTSNGGLSSISRVIDTYTLSFDTAVWKVI